MFLGKTKLIKEVLLKTLKFRNLSATELLNSAWDFNPNSFT